MLSDHNPISDMPIEEFRKSGHQAIDWIANFLENIETIPVLPDVEPGDIRKKLPHSLPQQGESMDEILSDISLGLGDVHK